jgi:hypothetical protein
VSRREHEVGEWPALDVRYRPNLPLPESIAPSDREVREATERVIGTKKFEFVVRLVHMPGRIVELRAKGSSPDADVDRFFDSLQAEL